MKAYLEGARKQLHPNPSFQMTKRRAVITGIGPITCIGIGREDFWRGIRAEKSGIRPISSFDTAEFNAHCGGEIPDWIPEDYFPPHRLKRLDRYAQFAVASAKMALDDAGLPYSARETAASRRRKFWNGARRRRERGIPARAFSEERDARGEPDSRAAGLRRLGPFEHRDRVRLSRRRDDELEQLRQRHGRGRRSASLHPRRFRRRHRGRRRGSAAESPHLRRVCDHQDDEPMDRRSGAGLPAVRSASATDSSWEKAPPRSSSRSWSTRSERGAHIYAEVLGYSLNNDAFHMTSPLPSGESCIRAMRDALADAQLAPEQIDYINAHASSTQLNDSTETMAIKQVFGDHARALCRSAERRLTPAHPLGATGAMEAAICALALDQDWIPPTLNRNESRSGLRSRCRSAPRSRRPS